MEEKSKVGIVGVGMVGGALNNYLQKRDDVEIFLYDKGRDLGSAEETNKADVVFICVPTPYNKNGDGFDLSFVESACKNLTGEKVVVIKSTVVPGTTEKLQVDYPRHKFIFNPEFLSEKTAQEDMEVPDRQIIGHTKESKDVSERVMNLLPDAPYKRIMPATEAEMVKYFNNTFNAIKVIFANQMYDLCEKIGVSYDSIMEASAKSKFIKTEDHLKIFHGGYRGYGGKCLVKDNRALIEFAKKNNLDLILHKTAEEINKGLMDMQEIDDPENFSKRT